MNWTRAQAGGGLRVLLGRPGWNLTKIAAVIGASYFTIINWKDGRVKPSNAYMPRLSELLEKEGMKPQG